MRILLFTLLFAGIFNEMTPYGAVPNSESSCPAVTLPEDCELVYISHYGRHGSRTDTRPDRMGYLMELFSGAEEACSLTPRGDSLYTRLIELNSYAQGHFSLLTPLGWQQHRSIASRMAASNPAFFAEAEVLARATTYPRCVSSMASFTAALVTSVPSLKPSCTSSASINALLNFYNPDYMEAAIEQIKRDCFADAACDTAAFLSSLFKVCPDKYESSYKLADCLYYAAGMCANVPVDVDVEPLLNRDVLQAISRANAQALYNFCADSPRFGKVRLPLAAKLLEDIVSRADEAICSDRPVVDLRFGHDAPLMTLLCCLGVSVNPDRLCDYIPMAANLQLLFVRFKGKSELLVLPLLNERPLALPFPAAASAPAAAEAYFYRWNDLKNHLKSYIHQ